MTIYIGLTGAIATGKGVAVECIEQCFSTITARSISDQIKIDLDRAGITQSRDNLHKHANDMRLQHGPGFWMLRALEAIEDHGRYDAIVVDGIRNTGEIIALRATVSHSIVLGFDANHEIRVERVRRRNRDVDGVSDSELLRIMSEEIVEEGPHGFQIHKCLGISDILVNANREAHEVAEEISRHLANLSLHR